MLLRKRIKALHSQPPDSNFEYEDPLIKLYDCGMIGLQSCYRTKQCDDNHLIESGEPGGQGLPLDMYNVKQNMNSTVSFVSLPLQILTSKANITASL